MKIMIVAVMVLVCSVANAQDPPVTVEQVQEAKAAAVAKFNQAKNLGGDPTKQLDKTIEILKSMKEAVSRNKGIAEGNGCDRLCPDFHAAVVASTPAVANEKTAGFVAANWGVTLAMAESLIRAGDQFLQYGVLNQALASYQEALTAAEVSLAHGLNADALYSLTTWNFSVVNVHLLKCKDHDHN